MKSDAILTTAKTAIADDASFNIRLDQHTCLDKDVLVLDRNFSLLKMEHKLLKLFDSHPNSSIILIGDQINNQSPSSNIKLIKAEYDDKGLINLNNLFQQLLKQGYHHILVEAGSYLSTTLFENDLIDELILFIAPFALPNKNAQSLFESSHQLNIDDSPKFKTKEILQLENDVMITYGRSWI
jgi:diaminohydroxyphosphoribosylaminopyrimidine deaminase/5-amino-6-(5-phosphoribosylamino)uracil reductase